MSSHPAGVVAQPPPKSLDQQSLDLILDSPDLALQFGGLVRSDRGGDDGAAGAASTAKRNLGGHKHVRHVLVLAEQRQMQQDLERLRVGGEHDELTDAAVQRLGRLVGPLLQLAVV